MAALQRHCWTVASRFAKMAPKRAARLSMPVHFMDEPPPHLEPQLASAPPPPAPAPPATSLPARLLNVFAVPGDVFEEIKSSRPSVANWLVPMILMAIVGVISAIVMFSQPAIQQEVREQQSKAIEQRVKGGQMTRAQADQMEAMAEKYMTPTM